MCNPPFYKSENEALEATTRKLKGLNKAENKFVRNFAGTHNELWYKGGEKVFIHNYLYESALFRNQCIWFTTLVSKKDLVKGIYNSLKKLGANIQYLEKEGYPPLQIDTQDKIGGSNE